MFKRCCSSSSKPFWAPRAVLAGSCFCRGGEHSPSPRLSLLPRPPAPSRRQAGRQTDRQREVDSTGDHNTEAKGRRRGAAVALPRARAGAKKHPAVRAAPSKSVETKSVMFRRCFNRRSGCNCKRFRRLLSPLFARLCSAWPGSAEGGPARGLHPKWPVGLVRVAAPNVRVVCGRKQNGQWAWAASLCDTCGWCVALNKMAAGPSPCCCAIHAGGVWPRTKWPMGLGSVTVPDMASWTKQQQRAKLGLLVWAEFCIF